MEEQKFVKKYGEGNWVRLRKHIKRGLKASEIYKLLYGLVSYATINRLVNKIRGVNK